MNQRWKWLFVSWAAIFVAMLAWSLATPIGSAPDDTGHIPKAAATVRGQFVGAPTSRKGIETFELPGDVANVAPLVCNAFNWNRPDDCDTNLGTQPRRVMSIDSGVGSYNPLYYAAVGWPTLFMHGNPAVYAMRALSALASSFFLAIVFYCVAQLSRGRAAVMTATSIAFTPMTFYLGGMINPNGLEIACLAAISALAFLIVATPEGIPATQHLVLLGVAIAVGTNLRATTALYIVVALVPPLIVAGLSGAKRLFLNKRVLAVAVPTAIFSAAGVAWTVFVSARAGYIPNALSPRPGWWGGLLYTLGETPEFFRQEIAVMGWIDARSPGWVYTTWLVLIVGLVVAWLVTVRGRGIVAGTVALAAAFLMPNVLQPPITHVYGFIWQGRYSLPLLVSALVGVGFLIARARPVRDLERWWMAALWSAGFVAVCLNLVAFSYALRRYSVGNLQRLLTMFVSPVWSPPGGVATVVVAYAVALSSIVVIGWWVSRRRAVPRSSEPTSSRLETAP